MNILKTGIIISALITIPVYFSVPFVIKINNTIISHLFSDISGIYHILTRGALLLLYIYIYWNLYDKLIYGKMKHSRLKESNAKIILFLFALPAVSISLFHNYYLSIINVVKNKYNFDLIIYSDFLSRIELNWPTSISVLLFVLWLSKQPRAPEEAA